LKYQEELGREHFGGCSGEEPEAIEEILTFLDSNRIFEPHTRGRARN
jgi:hypothetical protein